MKFEGFITLWSCHRNVLLENPKATRVVLFNIREYSRATESFTYRYRLHIKS